MTAPLTPLARRIDILGVPIDASPADLLVDHIVAGVHAAMPMTVLYANAHVVNLAQDDARLQRLLAKADMVLADGFGVLLGARILRAPVPERAAITDYIWTLAERCAENGVSVFLLGGKHGIAERSAQVLKELYPRLRVAGTHHGYMPDEASASEVASEIRRSGAELLLVGMGSPSQEVWIERYREQSGARVAMAVGGVFDFVSGDIDRWRPQWISDLGLEWVTRLCVEPRRMWSRYMVGNPLFVYRVVRASRKRRRRTRVRPSGGGPVGFTP